MNYYLTLTTPKNQKLFTFGNPESIPQFHFIEQLEKDYLYIPYPPYPNVDIFQELNLLYLKDITQEQFLNCLLCYFASSNLSNQVLLGLFDKDSVNNDLLHSDLIELLPYIYQENIDAMSDDDIIIYKEECNNNIKAILSKPSFNNITLEDIKYLISYYDFFYNSINIHDIIIKQNLLHIISLYTTQVSNTNHNISLKKFCLNIIEQEKTLFIQYCTDNITHIIAKIIKWKNNLIQSPQGKIFQHIYKSIQPGISLLYKNSQYSTINKYKIEVEEDLKRYYENRGLNKPFIPAGTCYYGDKISINTFHWNKYKKSGKMWAQKFTRIVYFHELGHAIDFPYEDAKILAKKIIAKSHNISYNDFFYTAAKKSSKNITLFNKKEKEILSYFITPGIKLKKDVKNPKSNITYEWNRTCEESFAESLGILCNWFLNGFDQTDTFLLKAKRSRERNRVKALLPTLYLLLKTLNWQYLGIPARLYRLRKIQIKNILNSINKTPVIIPFSHNTRKSKVFLYKKPISKDFFK